MGGVTAVPVAGSSAGAGTSKPRPAPVGYALGMMAFEYQNKVAMITKGTLKSKFCRIISMNLWDAQVELEASVVMGGSRTLISRMHLVV